MNKLKILELFGGIGACSKALERLGIEYEIADYVEIDKYAVMSFNAMHNTNFKPQDICDWNKDIEVDLIMHGSPCQDFSAAGLQAGGDEGSGTRSSLMYETLRIVDKLKPKYVIWENVKNLLSKKHIHNFNAYLDKMSEGGYINYYKVLNAKDYGIPQNRERVFTISIRKDIVKEFEFPEKKELKLKLKDMLEDNVDEKYYLDEDGLKNYNREFGSKGKQLSLFEPVPTLTASMGTGGGNIPYFEFPPKQELKLKLKDMLETNVDEKYYLSKKMINYISKTGTENYKNPDCKINLDIARPLTTDPNKRAGTTNYLSEDLPDNYDLSVIRKYGVFDNEKSKHQTGSVYDENGYGNFRIRRLTPKEAWRLMGFDDEDCNKASQVCSNTQLYKQAGNSIVVNILVEIFKELLKGDDNNGNTNQCECIN